MLRLVLPTPRTMPSSFASVFPHMPERDGKRLREPVGPLARRGGSGWQMEVRRQPGALLVQWRRAADFIVAIRLATDVELRTAAPAWPAAVSEVEQRLRVCVAPLPQRPLGVPSVSLLRQSGEYLKAGLVNGMWPLVFCSSCRCGPGRVFQMMVVLVFWVGRFLSRWPLPLLFMTTRVFFVLPSSERPSKFAPCGTRAGTPVAFFCV